MRSCLQVSISTKLFGRCWHVKRVIFVEYFLTFTSHLSLISRWQRHRDPGPRQDTHRSCWTWSSSCTVRCPPRTWTASSSSPAWWRARIRELVFWPIHFHKWERTMYTWWLFSFIFTWHEYLSHWKCNVPFNLFCFSCALGDFSRHGRPLKTSQTLLCPILPSLWLTILKSEKFYLQLG